MNSTILENLGIRVSNEIPSDFRTVTRPIPIDELSIIASIWSTLSRTEAVASLSKGKVSFWRRALPPRKRNETAGKYCVYNLGEGLRPELRPRVRRRRGTM